MMNYWTSRNGERIDTAAQALGHCLTHLTIQETRNFLDEEINAAILEARCQTLLADVESFVHEGHGDEVLARLEAILQGV